MSATRVLRNMGLVRIAFGLGLLISPRRLSTGWLTRGEAERPATRALLHSVGARDAVIGYVSLRSATEPSVAPHLLATLAFVDMADTVGFLAERRHLPWGIWPISIAGALAAAVELWTIRERPPAAAQVRGAANEPSGRLG